MKNNNLKKEEAVPVANFAKKERVAVPADIMSDMHIKIPPIYYWEDVFDGKSVLMTMAFQWRGRNFGMSYPIEDQNFVRINILRKKIFNVVKESLDVLIHHGEKILDKFGNIDPRLVNDQEAIRFRLDRYWKEKVAAFNKLVRIAPITKKKAMQLGLLDKPKIIQ